MRVSAALGSLGLLLLGGCAGYHIGNQTLFPQDVRTVSVQMFTSDSFRRDLAPRLTEAVAKEIERQTPYKIVRGIDADSVLSGHLIRDTKRGLVENHNDDLRDIEMNFYMQVNWQPHGAQSIALGAPIAMSPVLVNLNQRTHLVPEVGQSIVTAQQAAIERLARQIVAQMEVPW